MPPARTLAQVAAAAGVSRMTVSRVLRHPERVLAATRERVLAAIDALDYRPNPLISTLMTATRQRRASDTTAGIAFVISGPLKTLESYEVAAGVFAGARERAFRKGYELLPHSLSEERLPIPQLSKIFKARGIEGVIFGSLMPQHSRLPIDLTGLAAVAWGATLQEPALHVVAANQRALAAQAYCEARARGYQRIGVAIHQGSLQERNWVSAIEELRSPDSDIPILRYPQRDEAAFLQWHHRWGPDCVIGSSPEMLLMLRQVGRSAPDDVGFLLLGHLRARQNISGFAKNYEAIGATAVDLIALQLLDSERGLPVDRKTILLDPRWNEGTTIRPKPMPSA